MRRDRDNAYGGHDELTHLTREQKEAKYDALKESIRHKGFNEEFPIIIIIAHVNNENNEDNINFIDDENYQNYIYREGD